MDLQKDEDFEKAWQENRHIWESTKNLAKAMFYAGQAKAQAVPKWISVEDGLPSDGQDIIAFDAIKHCVFKDGEFLQGYFEPDTGHEYTEPVDVTHWIAIEAQEPAND